MCEVFTRDGAVVKGGLGVTQSCPVTANMMVSGDGARGNKHRIRVLSYVTITFILYHFV